MATARCKHGIKPAFMCPICVIGRRAGQGLLMTWDGLHIVGEVFGFTEVRADRFADTAWLLLTGALLAWSSVLLMWAR